MTGFQTCPKCGFTSGTPFEECNACGIIISKYLKREREIQEREKEDAVNIFPTLQLLEDKNALSIRQVKEWGEILTGFENRNRYRIMDGMGRELFMAEEEPGNLLTRLFLTFMRPFSINMFSENRQILFSFRRPFRFYFHEVEVTDHKGRLLGKVKKQFAFFRRIYTVSDAGGMETWSLFGPILRPWTFIIKKGDDEHGTITKKWSGLLKESFTAADNFGINFPKGISASEKGLFMGAVFLIDYIHFERRR